MEEGWKTGWKTELEMGVENGEGKTGGKQEVGVVQLPLPQTSPVELATRQGGERMKKGKFWFVVELGDVKYRTYCSKAYHFSSKRALKKALYEVVDSLVKGLDNDLAIVTFGQGEVGQPTEVKIG